MATASGHTGGRSILKESTYKLGDHERLTYYGCRQLWPNVKRDDIQRYFIHSPDIYKEAMKSFKSLEAYYYVKAGKVHNITVAVPEPGTMVLRGVVSASQKTNEAYTSWVATQKGGKILDAVCSCTAGWGRCCSHAAAVCYVLYFWSEKMTAASKDGVSATDIPCPWIMPRLKQSEPKLAKDLRYERHHPTGEKRMPSKKPKLNEDSLHIDFEAFAAKLKEAAPHARYFTLVEVNEKQREEQVQANNGAEPVEFYITVEQPLYGLTASEIRKRGFRGDNIKDMCHFAMANLKISKESADESELQTRGQASSPLWFRHRRGRITASNIKDVCSSRMTKTDSLTKKILMPAKINSPAIMYGTENENLAKERLMDVLRPSHVNARLLPCGLMINPSFPFLGCSPNGLFECDCHPPMLVEVKCLHTLRDVAPDMLVEEGQKGAQFCITPDGTLKQSHRYYYQVQAQLHLNIYGIDGCYFFLYIEKGGMLLTIMKENGFLDKNIEKVTRFFQDIILPRIILDD